MLKMTIFRLLSHRCRGGSTLNVRTIIAARGYGVILLAVSLFLCLMPGASQAQMSPLNNEDLRGITGQAGVSINLDGVSQSYYEIIKFSDSQTVPNWIELHNVTVDNGAGSSYFFSTRLQGSPNIDPITIDIATNSVGVTYVSMRDTSHINPRWYSVGSFVFNALNATKSEALSTAVAAAIVAYVTTYGVEPPGLSSGFDVGNPTAWTEEQWAAIQDPTFVTPDITTEMSLNPAGPTTGNQALGSIDLDALRQGPSIYRYWAPTVGQGIRFDYQTTISADALTYAYNTTATGALKFSNIHIAGAATGALDDPATPATWEFGGPSNVFKIGTIGDADNAPAMMDVGTDGGITSVYMSLPMAGAIRVAEVNFGGNNFGPIAIDGIQFHRLDLKISP